MKRSTLVCYATPWIHLLIESQSQQLYIRIYGSFISITLVFIIVYLTKYQNVITFVLSQVFFFFSSIVNLHSPGSDGRPIRAREREREMREYREAKIKLQLTHVPRRPCIARIFSLHDHHIKFVFRRHHSLLLSILYYYVESSMSILVFLLWSMHNTPSFLPIRFFSRLFFFSLLLFCLLYR